MGVVLFDLAKMRASAAWEKSLEVSEIAWMAVKYEMTDTHLGEQDWMTLVSFERPELIFPLSCLFNRCEN